MNTIVSCKGVFWLLSFSALAVLGNSLSAVAQTADTTSSFQLTQTNATEVSSSNVSASLETSTPSVSPQTPLTSTVPEVKPPSLASRLVRWKQQFSTSAQQETVSPVVTPVPGTTAQFPTSAQQETVSRVVTPVPGTTVTSSAAFSSQSIEPTSQPSTPSVAPTVKPSAHHVAQADINVTPGRVTRGGASYVGIAGNIGLSGSGGSALGDGNFTLISKIGLTNSISVRPSAVLGDNPVVLIPVTYDLNLRSLADPFSEPLPIAPYIGGGVAIDTGNSGDAAFLVTAGVDVPLTRQFTATVAVNAAFFSDPDVGLLFGVGYNFRGF
ncbi:MAG: hypothetical protein DSM106950_16045 [Stigonema ocellatum SAG 48.90 = DSM 106950]|nr:hypothetical protein [Stigonema ocellatum SAG 48.90 = DSM 106950]